MITEDYVSFETAKLLKEKGFNEATTNRYYNAQYDQIRTVSDTFMWHWNDEEFIKRVLMDGAIAIPTLQMAMKWLREVHGLFIHIDVIREASCWLVDIQDIKGDVSVYPIKKEFPNYEEACEAAIKYCLENLI